MSSTDPTSAAVPPAVDPALSTSAPAPDLVSSAAPANASSSSSSLPSEPTVTTIVAEKANGEGFVVREQGQNSTIECIVRGAGLRRLQHPSTKHVQTATKPAEATQIDIPRRLGRKGCGCRFEGMASMYCDDARQCSATDGSHAPRCDASLQVTARGQFGQMHGLFPFSQFFWLQLLYSLLTLSSRALLACLLGRVHRRVRRYPRSKEELAAQAPALVAAFDAPDPLPSHLKNGAEGSSSVISGELTAAVDSASNGATQEDPASNGATQETVQEAAQEAAEVEPTATVPPSSTAPVSQPAPAPVPAPAPAPPVEQFTGIDVKSRSRAAKNSLGAQHYAEGPDEEDDEELERSRPVADADSFQGEETSDSEEVDDDSDESDFVDDENAVVTKKRKGRKGNNKKKKKPTKKAKASSSRSLRVPAFSAEGTPLGDGDDVSMSETASAVAEGRGARRGARDRFISRFGDEGEDSESSPAAPQKVGAERNGPSTSDADRHVVEEYEYSLLPQFRHRTFCSRCGREPVPVLMRALKAKKKKNGNKKRRHSRKRDSDLEEDSDQEEERVSKLGAWFKCGVCIDVYHYQCLPGALRKEFVDDLKDEHLQDHLAKYPPLPVPDPDPSTYIPDPITGRMVPPPPGPPVPSQPLPTRVKIEEDARRIFELRKCWTCKKRGGRRCLSCGVSGRKYLPPPMNGPAEEAANAEGKAATTPAVASQTAQPPTLLVEESAPPSKAQSLVNGEGGDGTADEPEGGLMFRCSKCRRASHYECLDYFGSSIEESAESYYLDGHCHDCYQWNVPLDVILAWREDKAGEGADPEPEPVEEGDIVDQPAMVEKRDAKTGQIYQIPSSKDPSARASYLVKWQGASYRSLDWVPHAFLVAAYPAKLNNFLSRGSTVNFDLPTQDDPEDDEDPTKPREIPITAPLPDPDAEERIPKTWKTVDRVLDVFYHAKTGGREPVNWRNWRGGPEDPDESVKLVAKGFFKWCDLPYGSATREEPPEPSDPGYAEYVQAYKRFLIANQPAMRVPTLTPKQMDDLDKPRGNRDNFKPVSEQPSYIVGGTLMPFQLAGVSFMYYQWWLRKGCILADEMGLGKTVQIITFLSVLHHEHAARPFLVTVPNSTIGNWVREFERWAPSMRVVPFSGDIESRQIIEEFELYDPKGQLKTHVVLATYEALEKNISVFQRVQRWECLVVDEGQRLKSGKNGLLFVALQSLRITHRVLLSGTPLNNNLEELFNLLHFIDPDKWTNMEVITERYAELTPEKVEEVREILKPYFLRRTKDLVLNLPPLTEIVVPVSMSVLQRQIYRSVLEHNAAAIESIFQKTAMTKKRKTSFNNVLMELRKVLCHPYITAPEIEPRGVGPQQELTNLIEASSKFVLLSKLLPKLKAAGHRVLIFSQFKIVLNIIEPLLQGLKLKYLRLDGDTKQLDRQRGIDEFNALDSEYFCYLLSTRAGGVGINLTTADTVIMFDQDFNPHQDIQAISRAHRIGQKKPVRVFKLLVKQSCEEKIFTAGTRKLGLDHLIIQRIDAKDETDDVETILQFGAKAVFDDKEAEATAIRYSDADIDELLVRSAEPLKAEAQSAAGTFAQAKIWERGELDNVNVDGEQESENMHGFWSTILQEQEEAERQRRLLASAQSGRGKRRSTLHYQTDGPSKGNKRRKGDHEFDDDSESDDFVDEEVRSDGDSGDDFRPVNPADRAVDRAIRDSARQDARSDRPVGVGFGMKLGRRRREMSPASKHVADAERKQRRSQIILTLAQAAAGFDDEELDDLLTKAANAHDRIEQTQLMEEATRRLLKLHDEYVPPQQTTEVMSVQEDATEAKPEAEESAELAEPPSSAPSVGGVKEEDKPEPMQVDDSTAVSPQERTPLVEAKPAAEGSTTKAQELYDLFKPRPKKETNGSAETTASGRPSRSSPRKERAPSVGSSTLGLAAGVGGKRSTRARQSITDAVDPTEGDDGSDFSVPGAQDDDDDDSDEEPYEEDDDDDAEVVGKAKKRGRRSTGRQAGASSKKKKIYEESDEEYDE
ncbi:BQ2448_4137 [Microbotryum intermedium]|uniref:BQ2448_4137 protein n=1 Tax=Microbotryum intermedium TaxID=269621 RepID=A0A238FFL5_9BASI|nr:BQ2448_4137 [Microbotryum intermedium]